MRSLERHGLDIPAANYGAQTTRIESLVTDWETKPELSEAVAAVPGLEQFVAELKADNIAFHQQYMARIEEETELAKLPAPTRIRGDVARKWEQVRKRLMSLVDVHEEAEPWAGTIAELNVLIAHWERVLARRAAGRGGSSAADDDAA